MYLTRVTLTDRDAAQKRLWDTYAWHRALWSAFATAPEKARDFLTRIDHDREGFRAYILSQDEPTQQPWGNWQSRPLAPSFLGHDRYQFDLRANPIVSRVVRKADGNRRKSNQRIPLIGHDALADWIHRKGESSGFKVENCSFGGPQRDRFWHPRRRTSVTISLVDFTGILVVQDRKTFNDAYMSGVGPAKGFGCGLLLLSPKGNLS